MISQIFAVSPRGDCVVFKDYRGDSAAETFVRRLQAERAEGRDLAPAVNLDGTQFLHVRVEDLLWVATSRENISPSLAAELLLRAAAVVRDSAGSAGEESVRRNLALVYEVLDEVVDFGIPQDTATERLKHFLKVEPLAAPPGVGASAAVDARAAALRPTEIVKSVLDTSRTGPAKDEIFVDVVERLTATFDSSGHQKSSSIAGKLQIKSYLSGNPAIRLGLCDGLVIAGRPVGAGYAVGNSSSEAVVLDTCTFHSCVDQERLEGEGVLEMVPPTGLFSAMSYRSTRGFRPPFRLYPVLEDDAASAEKLTLYLRLRAEYPPTKGASGIEVRLPLPRAVQRVHLETVGPREGRAAGLGLGTSKTAFAQTAEWSERERQLVWALQNLRGGQEATLKARLTIDPGSVEEVKRDYGPITLQFVLPGKPSASGLDVAYMKILKHDRGYNPARWFRVVSLANSYQVRPHWL